eukprot:5944247-Pleurochrysis_carterae.AAC.1
MSVSSPPEEPRPVPPSAPSAVPKVRLRLQYPLVPAVLEASTDELSNLRAELRELRDKLESAEAAVAAGKTELNAQRRRAAAHRRELEKELRERRRGHEKAKLDIGAAILGAQAAREVLEGELASLTRQLRYESSARVKLAKKVADLQTANDDLVSRNAELAGEVKLLKESRSSDEKLMKKLEQHKERHQNARAEAAEAKAAAARSKKTEDQAAAEASQLKADLEHESGRSKQLAEKNTELSSALDEAQRLLNTFEEKVADLELL